MQQKYCILDTNDANSVYQKVRTTGGAGSQPSSQKGINRDLMSSAPPLHSLALITV